MVSSYKLPQFVNATRMEVSVGLLPFRHITHCIAQWLPSVFGGLRAFTDLAIAGIMCHILYSQTKSDLTQQFVDAHLRLKYIGWLLYLIQINFNDQSAVELHSDDRPSHKVCNSLLSNWGHIETVHVSVFATIYIAVVCSCKPYLPFHWLMAAFYFGTVSCHAVEHDIHCRSYRAWEEYVVIPLI
jgi:hypothetical protein